MKDESNVLTFSVVHQMKVKASLITRVTVELQSRDIFYQPSSV